MKRKIFSIFFALVLMLSFSLVTAVPVGAQISEVWVDDDFTEATAGWGTTHFATIQDGIDAVDPDGTVYVADGDYNATTLNSTQGGLEEGWWFVTISESLDLIGESRDGVILDGSQLYNEHRSAGIWVSASDVTIKNLTIQNFYVSDPEHYSYGLVSWEKFRNFNKSGEVLTLSYVTAENLKVVNCQASLYFMKTDYVTVKDCVVENSLADGIWVAMGSANATVQGNTVTNSADHGIWVGGASWCPPVNCPSATIIDNKINGAREGGISFVGSDGAIISGNTITNVAGEGWSVGALSLKDGCSNVEAFDNTIYNNDGSWGEYSGTGHGIGIDGTPLNINLYLNNIYNNTGYGCYNYSIVTVNAINNWWGDMSGPYHATTNPSGTGDPVSDNVHYSTWCAIEDTDLVIPGYQAPDPMTWGVSTDGTIQEAIDDASPNDTINVAAGTYSEHITINESSLNLIGEDRETTIIDATQDSSWTYPKPGILINGVSSVTVSGFTIRDAALDENGEWAKESYGPGPQAMTAILIYATSSDHAIEDNILINNYWGVFVCAEGSATTQCRNNRIAHNIIRDGGQDGVYLYTDGVVPVENTQIANNEIYNRYGTSASGVEFWAWPETEPKNLAITGTVITGNNITGCTFGVRIRDDVEDVIGTLVKFNNFIGSTTYGIYNGVASTIDATNNWWGTKGEGAIKKMVSGNVDYDPWIGAKAKDSKSQKTKGGEVTVDAKDKTDTDVLKKGKGKPTITVTEYTDNPGDGAAGGFSSVGKYIDVHLDDTTDVDEIEIRNYYTLADIAGLNEATLRLTWWNGTAWVGCSDSGVTYPVDDPTYRGYVWAKIRAPAAIPPTIPTLDDMAGTPFMSVARPPAPAGVGGGAPPPPPGTTNVRGMVSLAGVFYTSVTANSEDGLCRLTIPARTVGLTEELEPLTIITMLIMDEPPLPPEVAHVIGLVYDFQPSGATFEPLITLTFNYDPDNIPEGIAEQDLVLAYYDQKAGEWVNLEGTVDPGRNTITVLISHFTAFTIFGYEVVPSPTPAAFSVSNLSVKPLEVQPKEAVTITVLVANTGGSEGSYSVVLKINGVKEAEKSVTVAAGGSEIVAFSAMREEARTYSVVVDGLSAFFTVVGPVLPPTPPPPAPPPEVKAPINWPVVGGIIAAAVVVVGLLIFFVVRRRRAP